MMEDEDPSSWKFNYWRRLSQIRVLTTENESIAQTKVRQTSPYPPKLFPITQQMHQRSRKTMHSLHDLITRIKVQRIVKEFVYKLKRNVQKNQKQKVMRAQMIKIQQKAWFLNKHHKIQGFSLPDQIRAVVSIITILCVVMTQCIATFQCFLPEFNTLEDTNTQIIKYCMLFFLLAKLISGFLLTRYKRYVQIVNLKQIWKAYLTSHSFKMDLLLVITVFLLIVAWGVTPIAGINYICSLIATLSLPTHLDMIQNTFITNQSRMQYWALTKLLFFNIYFTNIVGSFLLAITSFGIQQTWIDLYGIDGHPWYEKYIYSYYYAAAIISTTGFGDIVVGNFGQAILVSSVMLFGCLILSFNINQIGNILQDIRNQDMDIKGDLVTLNRLAKANHVNPRLQREIAKFIVNSSKLKNTYDLQARKKLLDKLPQSMRQDLRQQASSAIFRQLPFFDLLQSDTKIILSESIKFAINYPGQYLTNRRTGLTKILVLRQGTIGLGYLKPGSSMNGTILQEITVQKQGMPPYLLNKYLLKVGKQINYSLIANSYCMFYELEFQDFQAGLRSSKHDYQFFRQIYDSADLNSDEYDSHPCQFCSQKFHSIFSCPLLHYMPYRNIIFLRYQRQPQKYQMRNSIPFTRKRRGMAKRKIYVIWKKVLRHYQTVFSIKDIKNYTKRQILDLSRKQRQSMDNFQNVQQLQELIKQMIIQESRQDGLFSIDSLYNFPCYFSNFNPQKLNYLSLNSNDLRVIVLERMSTLDRRPSTF